MADKDSDDAADLSSRLRKLYVRCRSKVEDVRRQKSSLTPKTDSSPRYDQLFYDALAAAQQSPTEERMNAVMLSILEPARDGYNVDAYFAHIRTALQNASKQDCLEERPEQPGSDQDL